MPKASAAGGRSRSNLWRFTWLTLITLTGLLVIDAAYVFVRARSLIPVALESFEQGRSFLADGKVSEANRSFQNALDAARQLERLSHHPVLTVASWLPAVGDDVAVARGLADAAVVAARAGESAGEGAERLGVTPAEPTGSLYRNGRVDLDAVEQVAPFVAKAHRLLGTAGDELERLPTPEIGVLEDNFARARTEIAAASNAARRANLLLDVLPTLLGEMERQRYLLAFQALGEARATGGLIGYYGVLSADGGRIRLGHVGPIAEVTSRLTRAVEGPRWFERNYGSQSALRQVQQVNLSPNFPVVADVLLNMFEESTGERLDGVIAMDAVTLEQLMEGTSPVRTTAFGVVDSSNVFRYVTVDSYTRLSPDAQNQFFGELIGRFWKNVTSGDIDERPFAERVAAAVTTQHLKVFTRDAQGQDSLVKLEAAGDYTSYGPNLQLVFHNNYGPNKVDVFLQRSIDVEIDLNPDGSAKVETRVELINEAPRRAARELVGPISGFGNRGDSPGLNRMLINFLVPKQAEFRSAVADGRRRLFYRYYDAEYRVFAFVVEVEAGETADVSFSYKIPNAITREGLFVFNLVPQTLATPDAYSVSIGGRDDFRLSWIQGSRVSSESLSRDGELLTPTSFRARVLSSS